MTSSCGSSHGNPNATLPRGSPAWPSLAPETARERIRSPSPTLPTTGADKHLRLTQEIKGDAGPDNVHDRIHRADLAEMNSARRQPVNLSFCFMPHAGTRRSHLLFTHSEKLLSGMIASISRKVLVRGVFVGVCVMCVVFMFVVVFVLVTVAGDCARDCARELCSPSIADCL